MGGGGEGGRRNRDSGRTCFPRQGRLSDRTEVRGGGEEEGRRGAVADVDIEAHLRVSRSVRTCRPSLTEVRPDQIVQIPR